MKHTLIMLSMALVVIPLSYQSAHAQTNDAMQAALRNREITGLMIDKTNIHWWRKGKTLEESKGMEQYALIQGNKILILYGEFNSNNEAHQAFEIYPQTVASVFHRGLWSGAQNRSIGDESCSNNEESTGAILFRSGRTCVLVSCYGDGNNDKWTQVVELLAKHIEDKIQKGGRVIVPEPPASTPPPSLPQVPQKPLRPLNPYVPK